MRKEELGRFVLYLINFILLTALEVVWVTYGIVWWTRLQPGFYYRGGTALKMWQVSLAMWIMAICVPGMPTFVASCVALKLTKGGDECWKNVLESEILNEEAWKEWKSDNFVRYGKNGKWWYCDEPFRVNIALIVMFLLLMVVEFAVIYWRDARERRAREKTKPKGAEEKDSHQEHDDMTNYKDGLQRKRS